MKAIGIDIGITNICGILIDAETGAVEKSITYSNDAFIHFQHSFQKTQEVRKIVNIVDKIADAYPDKLAMLHVGRDKSESRFTFRDIKRWC